MTQQHHEEAESGSEGEGEASARRSASDLRAAGIDGVGSGDGIEAGSSARLDGPHDGDDGENGSGDGYSEGGDKGSGPNGTPDNLPRAIEIRGARVHNLRGHRPRRAPAPSWWASPASPGSGKSSLALGVLYAEGLAALSGGALHLHAPAHDPGRRRPDVDEHRVRPRRARAAPAARRSGRALAPSAPQTELLNSLRLMFSRLGSHRCPNGHAAAAHASTWRWSEPIVCPECGAEFYGPSAEELAFNSAGRLPRLRRHGHRARGGPRARWCPTRA